MNTLNRRCSSSLGKKYVMAVTGLALFGFVVAHMVGNLQIFLGREILNGSGAFLKSKPLLLWGARLGLICLVSLHVWAAIRLTQDNRAARPVAYAVQASISASYASRTMLMSGLIVASFIVFHLMHFTLGGVDPEFLEFRDGAGRHDVYRMVVAGFSTPIVSIFYFVGMALLCLHLSHGVSALFQSLGLRTGHWVRAIDLFAKAAALTIFVGNCSIPLAVLIGLLK